MLLRLACEIGQSRDLIDAVFQRAHTRFQTYYVYYSAYVSMIMPKWYGEPGDIPIYVQSLLSDPGGDVGAMAYAHAAQAIAWQMASPSIYHDTGLSWEEVRHGFALRARETGMDEHAWIVLCYYAVRAGDRAAAREAYSHTAQLNQWPGSNTEDFSRTVLPWIMQRD